MRGAATPPRFGQPVDVLVALEHADEERLRTRRDRLRLLLEERVEVHVGGKLVGRLEAELAHEPGRVAGHRSDAVGSAKRTECDAVRDRAQHAAQP